PGTVGLWVPAPWPFAALVVLVSRAGEGGTAGPGGALGSQRIGIAEFSEELFADPAFHRFERLGVGHVRRVVPVDVVEAGGQDLARLDRWMAGARQRGLEAMASFGVQRTDRHLPSDAEYRRNITAFMDRYSWVHTFSPWNEPNHRAQPTHTDPATAARFYRIVRSECERRYDDCRVVALEPDDQSDMAAYVRGFLAELAPERPKLWGFHDYVDVNRRVSEPDQALKKLLALVEGEVWLSETGGWVKLGRRLPYDENRSADALRRLFAVAERHRDRVRRVYVYEWFQSPGNPWDSALVAADRRTRPGYDIVEAAIRRRTGD
ncbi:MAG: hypothetical protein ACR2NA_11005, partial [Solirubrobacterales bacterium]